MPATSHGIEAPTAKLSSLSEARRITDALFNIVRDSAPTQRRSRDRRDWASFQFRQRTGDAIRR